MRRSTENRTPYASRARLFVALTGLMVVGVGCTPPEPFRAVRERVITCTVTRQECSGQVLREDGTAGCGAYNPPITFQGNACGLVRENLNERCFAEFCVQPDGPASAYRTCTTAAIDATTLPLGVTCAATIAAMQPQRLALVEYTQTSRTCVPSEDALVCASLPEESRTERVCFDSSRVAAVDAFRPASDQRDGRVEILSVVPNADQCPLAGVAAAGARIFDITPGVVGTGAGAGIQVPLMSRRGSAVVTQDCDATGEFCTSALDRLDIDLADATVAGVPLRNLSVINMVPARIVEVRQPNGQFRATLPARALRLRVAGLFNGAPSLVRVENRSPLFIDFAASTFSLAGRLDFEATDAASRRLPIGVVVNVRGQASTPRGQACALASSRDRLFGFEDPLSWTSAMASLSLVTAPVTQGCGALGIQGQNYMPITGEQFSTIGLAVQPAVAVDLFIPGNQPNPYWLGALQLYLTCPSANVFNRFVGQVELTGRPQDRFSSLRFPLDEFTRATLIQPLQDCQFAFALNVNPTGRTWVLDNLHFAP